MQVGFRHASGAARGQGSLGFVRSMASRPKSIPLPIAHSWLDHHKSYAPLRATLKRTRADNKGKFDEVVEDKGVRIIIEPQALMHVLGTKMDYVKDDLR